MKKLKIPTQRVDQPVVPIVQERFDAEHRDIPASEIPNNAFARALNVLPRGEWWEVRPGTALWSAANLPSVAEEVAFSAGGAPLSPLPSLPGRADYVASKSGDIITKTEGDDFISTDLYKFFEWPEGIRDIIVEVLSGTQLRAKSEEERTDSTEDSPARIVGRMNSRKWHDPSRLVFIHIDTRVFYTNYLMRVYTEVLNVSATDPTDEKTTMDDYKGFVDLFTSDGLFRIDPNATPIQMYRMNTAVRDNTMEGTARNSQINVVRRYISSMTRLDDEGYRNRGSARIMKETSTNNVIKTGDEYTDYVELAYVSEPNGGQEDVAGAGIGGEMSYLESAAALVSTVDDWQAAGQVSFDFTFTVPGLVTVTYEVVCNLAGVESWEDIAETIQNAIRDCVPETPFALCKYINRRFYIFAGIRDYELAIILTAGGVGTDISGTIADPSGGNYLDMAAAASQIYASSEHVVRELVVPPGERQWTHFSIYGTKSVDVKETESFEQACARQGVSATKYAWLDDVPVAKAFTASMSDRWLITATRGTFEKFDVGSWIRFENGDHVRIQEYVSSTQVYADGYSRWNAYAPSVGVYSQSAAIGDGLVMTASQDGTTIKRTGGAEFRASDTVYFWADGGYSYLKEWVSVNEIEVWQSANRPSQGLTTAPIKRNYNDTISNDSIRQDKSVEARLSHKELIASRRFFIALPNGSLGRTTAGMMFVAARGGDEVFYSNAPSEQEGLFGHYNPFFQRTPVKDSVQSIWEFPDKVVIFGSNQTFKILTNTFNEIINPKTNEYIAVIVGIAVISSNIGIKNQGSIQPIENGECVVVTFENGAAAVRRFNGKRYGENLCVGPDGLGFMWDDIKRLQSVVATGYNELYGYMLWGTEEETINGQVLELDKCYRLGIQPSHAKGWGELGGDGWIYPEPEIDVITVFSDIEQPFLIIWDAETGLPYRLATRTGPEGSNITRVWRDKIGIGYEAGYEIAWYIYLKEHKSPQENQLLRFLTAFFAFRPQDEANKGTEGYTQAGFRNAQEITIDAYKNGELVATVRTRNIPDRADVTFTKLIEDNRIQYRISGTASEIRGVNYNVQYELKDQRGIPSRRFMSEHDWQEELAEPHLWICRNVVTNLADGNEPTGSLFNISEGPDGEDSRLIFSAASSLLYSSSNTYAGDYTFMFGVYGISTTTEIMRIGSTIISIVVNGSSYRLRFNDGAGVYDQLLNWRGSGWALLKLSRNEDRLIFSQDGVQLMSMILGSIETLSGNYNFAAGNAKSLFDVRLYPVYISESCFEYYNRDANEYDGIGLLCPA